MIMNTIIEKFLNKISLDERVSNGIFEIENNDHLDIFQEYLQNLGASEEESIHARNRMIEGKFPDRQAYNKNGILVTFPTPEYKQRALQRGTHFEKNPKAGQTNLQFTTPSTSDPAPATPTPAPATPAPTPATPAPTPATTAPTPATPAPALAVPTSTTVDKETKRAQEKYVEKILTTESTIYTIREAKMLNFYKKGNSWYDQGGELIGVQFFDESKNTFLIRK